MSDKQTIEKYLLNKIDRGEYLSERILEKLVYTFSHTDKTLRRDWGYERVASIVKLSNRYFYLEYDSEDDGWFYKYTFDDQPTEVHSEIRMENRVRWITSSGELLL
ncbi:hypothetical protein [Snodgrassella sp. ESL0324]|uniref:hypothetical protein n=1 Tax=Snodgrassella sp. ESL0324 TaxID=2705033 RepID=UPI001583C481|nr:hypothetical protein [Snodgrassella sp. ESL0324]NUF08925.1 hypothetical protein [Snodgrassella sp. ESL0324]